VTTCFACGELTDDPILVEDRGYGPAWEFCSWRCVGDHAADMVSAGRDRK
jgi:hypothetical protein